MKRIITIGLIIISKILFGQVNESAKIIHVNGFIKNNKVLLRWVPDNPISWLRGNKYGYSVYRKVVVRDGKVIEKPDSILIGSFTPQPLNKWEPFADSSHFAVAAEAIYGKNFEITTKSNSFLDMVNRSREQDSRFTIGLVCADQSFSVACLMGLGLVDSMVSSSESYLYKVVSNYADSSGKKEIGYGMVDFGFGNFLPRPFGVTYQVNENSVTIMVPYEPFKGVYTNYELQRSDDGKCYKTVKDKSFYSLSSTPDDPKYNIYTDSLISQASTVYYRLRGRTPFDEYGPYSDSLSVKIMPSLGGEPWITDIKEFGSGNLMVNWNAPEYKKENLKGFMIYSSKQYDGPYNSNSNVPVEPDNSSALISAPSGYAYFRVAAIDQFNRPYYSAPRLYQAIDSIPPVAPSGLTGLFDTTGVVNLKWKYGKEKDLLCYQVLYSANIDSEYSLVSKDFIYDSVYTASFSTGMLCSDMFFKVVALDTRYNTSLPSEPLKLVKPDKIPPSAPVILVDTDSTGLVKVSIAPSSSNDVTLHRLYFVSDTDNSKKEEVFKGVFSRDTAIVLSSVYGKGYLYCVAEDFTGRKGISNRLSINMGKSNVEKSFSVLAKPLIDDGLVELRWDKVNVKGSIMIYRKNDTSSFNLIATVDYKTGMYKDRNVILNTVYFYKLVVSQSDGGVISRVVNVKFL